MEEILQEVYGTQLMSLLKMVSQATIRYPSNLINFIIKNLSLVGTHIHIIGFLFVSLVLEVPSNMSWPSLFQGFDG